MSLLSITKRVLRRAKREYQHATTSPFRTWGRRRAAIAFLDDSFPLLESGFRFYEYTQHLLDNERSALYSAPRDTADWGARLHTLPSEYRWVRRRTFRFDPRFSAQPEAAYLTFLFNANKYEPWLTRWKIPFVLQLYPGGDFRLADKDSDEVLRRVCESSAFRGIISTQPNTTRYLLSDVGIATEQVHEIYGVTYVPRLSSETVWRHRELREAEGNNGEFVIGFAANRYVPGGADKGFDVFCRIAYALKHERSIRFVCVGPWTTSDVPDDVDAANVTFLPSVQPEILFEWLLGVDVFLNPVRSNMLGKGAFDGFPTTVAVMAALAGCALVTTDPEKLNGGRFEDGAAILVLGVELDEWIEAVLSLFRDVSGTRRIARRGSDSFGRYFNRDYQIKNRQRALQRWLNVEFNAV